MVFNGHSIESESYVSRWVIWKLESHSRPFEVLIRDVKEQSDFTKIVNVLIK